MSCPVTFLSSAALPKEKALRNLDVLLFDLAPFSLIAASCLAAGLSGFGPCDDVGGFVGDETSALAPLLDGDPEAMVTGLDNGDGLSTRFPTSVDELLGGMLTSLG